MTRRPNNVMQERFVLTYDNASLTADTVVKLAKLARAARIDTVRYCNPTGLAADASNYFHIKVKNGSTVIADWSTETGQDGALTADTFMTLVASATAADAVLAADDVISVQFDETGTATLPAGRLVIEGRYL